MAERGWKQLSGTTLDSFELGECIKEKTNYAVFLCRDQAREWSGGVSLQLFREGPGFDLDHIARRFSEASYLDHPNLLRILKIGRDTTSNLLFVASEGGTSTLTQLAGRDPLGAPEALEVTRAVVPALRYLHSENFVFCNLATDSVWRIGPVWKLADFSQLRLIGQEETRALRLALARLPGVPPEAYEGIVSPAWDVWSLGVLLQRILTPEPAQGEGSTAVPRGRYLRDVGLPIPFDTITRDCLQPGPASRTTLADIETRVNSGASSGQQEPSQPTSPTLAPPAVVKATAPPALAKATAPPAPSAPPPGPAAASEQTTGRRRFGDFWAPIRKQPLAARSILAFSAGIILVAFLAVIASSIFWPGTSSLETSAAPNHETATESDRSRANSAPMLPAVAPPAHGEEITNTKKETSGEQDAGEDGTAIQSLFNRWLDAGRNRDAKKAAECYAPIVSTLYGHRRVTREEVYRQREHTYSRIGKVNKLEASNIQITQLDPNTAVILFDKMWDFGETKRFTGAERAQLTLGKARGEWKITGERELNVYEVRRPDGQRASTIDRLP